VLTSCNGPQGPGPAAGAPDEPAHPGGAGPAGGPQAKSTGEPPTGAGGGAATESQRLVTELGTAIEAWVAALDHGDEKTLRGMLVSEDFLRENIKEGNYAILSGTLLHKNENVVSELLKLAAGREVKLLDWNPGTATRTRVGTSIFINEFPLVTSSVLELSIGEWPVEIELRQSVKDGGAWKIMDLAVRN
jgi:hypothetical protein